MTAAPALGEAKRRTSLAGGEMERSYLGVSKNQGPRYRYRSQMVGLSLQGHPQEGPPI